MRKNMRAASAAFGMLACAAAPAASEEGMWTFNTFPFERMRESVGWAPDQAWLNTAMVGTARIPLCSGSNVSDAGLLLTNQHCVIACITSLSTAEMNYLDVGFMAYVREEERRCPNFTVQILQNVTDVTARIDAAARNAGAVTFARARDAEIATIQNECSSGPRRCEVVTLYDGGRYALYEWRRYDDVRLVFAPERAMAAFGGDVDNFSFPRFSFDIAFLRLYENGAPARTPNHLSLSFASLAEDDVVLTSGNPGPTSRSRTAAELAFERDMGLPWQIETLTEARTRLRAYAAQGSEQTRLASTALQSVENSLQGLAGRRAALANAQGFAHVTARDQDLQTRVRRNQAAQRDTGDAWDEIERAQTAHRSLFYQYQCLELRAAERSQLFLWARDIVRAAAERGKPETERLWRYHNARLGAVAQSVRTARETSPELEALHLTLWLEGMQRRLARDPALQRVLNGETPQSLAARLSQSRLADPTFRAALWDGGAEAVAASDDPLIAFVRAWDADARAARERYVTQVELPVARAHERIARARFRAFGEGRYPEATFTPRVSFGRVEGWSEQSGVTVGAFTTVDGLYARATDAAPFALGVRWLDARDRLDGDVVFNLATSTDVIGGNSGSPLLNREGRVVGVVFDSNLHALGGEYFYDRDLNRTVSVSSAIIRDALHNVYGMDALLAELGAEQPTGG